MKQMRHKTTKKAMKPKANSNQKGKTLKIRRSWIAKYITK